jgi:glycosyltransferase involved in cell wall biosynthesis
VITICLAICDPDRALLEAQLASIETQTRHDWRCIVTDDASSPARVDWLARRLDGRYRLIRGERRVGFYRNFERALAAVEDSRFVALCDQDDRWHPEKLARSVAALEASDAAMVVSARRIVDERGVRAIAPAPRVRDLGLLLLENTVAGAASLFRRALLDRALPFPDAAGAFHDHWLACVAMLDGGIVALDEPLVDYRQHAGNVIGHRERSGGAWRRALALAANPRRWPNAIAEARQSAARELPRLERFAAELARRFPDARLRLDVAGLLALEARALYAGEAAGIAGQLALGRLAARIASSQA